MCPRIGSSCASLNLPRLSVFWYQAKPSNPSVRHFRALTPAVTSVSAVLARPGATDFSCLKQTCAGGAHLRLLGPTMSQVGFSGPDTVGMA